MIIGVPKEIKEQEHRVGLVPASVREFVAHGHSVLVEQNAGVAINFSNDDYRDAGAKICDSAQDIFADSEMIIKVKEPQASEYRQLREGQVLFAYLHLAADKEQAEGLMKSGCVAIAYETVTGVDGGSLPLLAPMSEIAGRLSVQAAAHYLQKHLGGCGRLIGGVPGVEAAHVVILGGGMAGINAARMAVGLEAQVTIVEKSPEQMRYLDDHFQGRVNVVYSSAESVAQYSKIADVIIGAVLIPGASAPKLLTKKMLSGMKKGAVIVDIAIDQGGCFETSRPTTHADPVYVIDDIVHYCVANMPGAVPLTSALALNFSVLPYALKIADMGWQKAAESIEGLQNGLNICYGEIVHKAVAKSLN